MALKPYCQSISEKAKNPSFICNHQDLFHFISLGLFYFHLLYNIFNYSSYIYNLVLNFYQSYSDVSKYHLLTTHTYNYIYEQSQGLAYYSLYCLYI